MYYCKLCIWDIIEIQDTRLNRETNIDYKLSLLEIQDKGLRWSIERELTRGDIHDFHGDQPQ